MKHLLKSVVLIVLLTVLIGCGNNTDPDVRLTEDIYNHLEETIKIEEEFEVMQNEMNELEEADQGLYVKMTELGNENSEELIVIVDEAIELLEKRLTLIIEEKNVLDESKAEFLKVEDLVDQLKDETKKEIVTKLFTVMMERYQAYEDVYEEYVYSIEKTEELYYLFKEEQFKEEEAYGLINEVNTSYDSVNEANTQFNERTIKYNESKKEFYDLLNED